MLSTGKWLSREKRYPSFEQPGTGVWFWARHQNQRKFLFINFSGIFKLEVFSSFTPKRRLKHFSRLRGRTLHCAGLWDGFVDKGKILLSFGIVRIIISLNNLYDNYWSFRLETWSYLLKWIFFVTRQLQPVKWVRKSVLVKNYFRLAERFAW